MQETTSIKRQYLELQVKMYLNRNRKLDLTSLVTGLLSSEQERVELAVKLSADTMQYCKILGCSERTAFRQMERYGVKLSGIVKNRPKNNKS